MTDLQVLGVLRAIDRHWVKFNRTWFGFGRNDHVLKPGKIVSPYHIKSLIGAGLVEPRLPGGPWVYRLTPLGKILIEAAESKSAR
jgi:hypothetical protein